MSDKFSTSEEVVIKEYPKTTQWLDGYEVKADGNLILTNKRLLFIRKVTLSEEQVATVQKMSQEATTEKMIQLALSLHKKNFQISLSSLVSAKLGVFSVFPGLQFYLRVLYRTSGKNIKTQGFRFRRPFMRQILFFEWPTLSWRAAINKAVKTQGKTIY